MGEKLKFFQLGILIIFGIFAGIGVLVIALNKGPNSEQEIQEPVVIWGPPFENQAIQKFLEVQIKENESFEKVSYVVKNPDTMYNDLLEAIATDKSPDLVILNSTGLLPLKNKLAPISYDTYPLSTYTTNFIEGSHIFALPEAIYAIPLLVDPLVLYWNRDLYASEGVAQVPKDWDSFIKLIPRFSSQIRSGDLVQSAVAFGEYDNVLHAKEILSTLYMQTGAKMVFQHETSKAFQSDLDDERGKNTFALALQFYTSFSDPNKNVYSWNKTFDRSREAFSANKVAMYGGFISEQKTLSEINPNLNFGVALWPQLKNSVDSVTYGNFHAVAVLQSSKNPPQALRVALLLTNSVNAKQISELSGLPSARIDVLAQQDVTDPFSAIKSQSALIARTWLEPAPRSDVDTAFARAITTVVAGTQTPDSGTVQVGDDIEELLRKYDE